MGSEAGAAVPGRAQATGLASQGYLQPMATVSEVRLKRCCWLDHPDRPYNCKKNHFIVITFQPRELGNVSESFPGWTLVGNLPH